MHTARLPVAADNMRFKWLVAMVLGGVTGCLPFTVSGAPEFCTIVALPFCLGFVICRWWSDSLTRLGLALALPLFGSFVRLLSSSLHDGPNWFGSLVRALGVVGLRDPYLRRMLLTLLFPVLVAIVATVMFMVFQRRHHAKKG
jgi:hypothetical protein